MEVEHTLFIDINEILKLYESTANLNRVCATRHHLKIEKILMLLEIKNKQQWKVTINKKIMCVFSLSFKNSLIWMEKNNCSSVYINRITISPECNYCTIFSEIINWIQDFVGFKKIDTIKIHTNSENKKIIANFKKCGFTFSGYSTLKNQPKQIFKIKNQSTSLYQLNI
ncbi:hypothetical protein H9I45_15520 [Polaribacter haliotis]|uniref:N-acetyltransferase domain-containing protein n=1 Tax=Polaribacter haliotis TaxID=1888915 RepID=A0A7L8AFE5_9FLAO|nr:hypothetical protein [Polaribacter haliotis]QOD60728.1 hypothetical protein H9I45_15520 [Polaribacter haliotis]